ncbi:MAG: class I SAM-dependent methyltransferase, partial [Spartobacteria bacterium]|nr:class I SAM-dependent methyltransferase [Spartobacteria bacterium]
MPRTTGGRKNNSILGDFGAIQMKKTMSTGFERSKLHAYASLLKYFQKNKEFAKNDYQLFLETKKIFRRHLGALSPDTRILEIGCGQRFIQTLLFTTEGATITGIDYDFISKTYSIGNICTIWKQNGFERCIKTLVRHMMYDGKYYQCIEEEYGKPLRWDKVDVRKMSACALAFPDKHFDFIFSNAVFEHIEDVEAAFAETARVLKPSGLALIRIHLYASLSGGHHLDWADPTGHPSKTVPPWDHLRKNLYPPHLYLNKLRKAE